MFEQEDEEQAATLLEDKPGESEESESEDEAHLQLRSSRAAAWVDEDDELEEE